MSKQAVIVAYGRSAVCRAKKGALARSHPIDWSAQVLCGVLDRVPELDEKSEDDGA